MGNNKTTEFTEKNDTIPIYLCKIISINRIAKFTEPKYQNNLCLWSVTIMVALLADTYF